MMKSTRKNGSLRFREKICSQNGKIIYSPHFDRITDAKSWKRRMLTERDRTKALGLENQILKKVNFKDYALHYFENKIQNLRSLSTMRHFRTAFSKHLFPVLQDLNLDEIKIHHADSIVQKLLKSGNNEAGINKIMQVLKSILIAAERAEVIHKNPLRHYPKLRAKQRTPTFWSALEINQFLRASKEDELYPLFVVALNTGMRRGELSGLCWDKVHFSQGVIEVSRTRDRDGLKEGTKTGRMRPVPMNSITKATLLRLYQNRSSEYVFTTHSGTAIPVQHVYRLFERAQKNAGMKKMIRFHDLRHCYASHFVMSVGNLYDLQKILGHSKAEMTQIYAHLSQQHLLSVADTVLFGELEKNGANLEPTPQTELLENLILIA